MPTPFAIHGYGHGVSWTPEPWSAPLSIPGGSHVVTLHGNSRAVLTDLASHAKAKFNLLGKTLKFTVDVSSVPCGTNAALYFVSANELQWGNPVGEYCDINTQPACTELDIFEGNLGSLQSTIHTTANGWEPDGTCNQAGCTVNWGNYPRTASGEPTSHLYGHQLLGGPGAGSTGIDTARPFDVLASVSAAGELTVELLQDATWLPFFNVSSAGNPTAGQCEGDAAAGCGVTSSGEVRSAPRATAVGVPPTASTSSARAWGHGLVLIASLWGSPDLEKWLDGQCPKNLRGGADSPGASARKKGGAGKIMTKKGGSMVAPSKAKRSDSHHGEAHMLLD